MRTSVVVHASCLKCSTDLEISGGQRVNDRFLVVIHPCPVCHPKEPKKKPKKTEVRDMKYENK